MSSKLMVTVSGKKLEGFAQMIKGKLWLYYQGQTLALDIAKGTKRRKSVEGKSSKTLINAPMPGKITKIFVGVEQSVDLGQAIIVMEAMKMEYTLKCEINARVENILVRVGDQVQLGQSLVKMVEVET
jgi:biotin carboxyl carrier protein